MFKNQKFISLISTVLVLGIAFAVTLGYRMYINRDAEKGVKDITVNVVIDTDDLQYSETYEIETKEEYLGYALVENMTIVTQGNEGSRYITGVDNIDVDSTKEEWWKILINGDMGSVGMDEQTIKDGDVITLEFNVGFN